MDEYRNLTCKSAIKYCNVIKPTQRANYTNLPNEIQETYKRICTTNDGTMAICCDKTMVATTDEGRAFLSAIKKKYPRIKINRNRGSDTTIDSIELYKPDAPPGLVSQATEQITPHILCKIANATIQPLNKYADVATNLTEDCYTDNCDNLEREITIDHLQGKGGPATETATHDRYVNDLKLAEYIADNNEFGLREYIRKYGKIDHPLIHDEQKNRIIHLVAQHNMTEGLNILMALDANINVKNIDGDTPLHVALRNGAINVVEILLQQGANTAEKNKAGETPIFAALNTRDNIPVGSKLRNLRTMYNSGASLFVADGKNNNLLHYTIINIGDAGDRYEIAEYLIRNGVDLMRKNTAGKIPLDLVADTAENQALITLMRNMMFKQKYNSARGTFHGSVPVGSPVDIDAGICFGRKGISPDLPPADCIAAGGQYGKASLDAIQFDIEYPPANVADEELHSPKAQNPIVVNTLPAEIVELNNSIRESFVAGHVNPNYLQITMFLLFGLLGLVVLRKTFAAIP